MPNSIFVIGSGGSDIANVEAGHLFGGIMTGSGSLSVIEYGMDFGGDTNNISLEGHVGEALTQDLILIPISEEATEDCQNLLTNLQDLTEDGRWPFEYYTDATADPLQFRPYKTHETFESGEKPRKRAQVNCITFFNWAARACGINTTLLHEEWNEASQDPHVRKQFNDLYNDVFFYKRGQIRHESTHGEYKLIDLVLEDGYKGLMIRNTSEQLITAHRLASRLCQRMGGYQALKTYMETLDPFDCEPEPLDPYLEQEFRDLRIG